MLHACAYNVGSNYCFVIVLSIFDSHMHHKLDITILQEAVAQGITILQEAVTQIHNYFQFHHSYCSELSSLGQRSLITTEILTWIIKVKAQVSVYE